MNLSKKALTILAIVGVVGLFIFIYVATAYGYRSDCVHAEAGIKAQYEQNQNNYDNMWKKFKEVAQVTKMQADDVEKVYKATLQGRYGADGSKALFQMIKENNPQLDGTVYRQLQRTIEAGRTSFAADQQQLIDQKRQYEVVLNDNRSAFVGMWFHYPIIDLSKYGIVTSDQTQEAFTTKKAPEVQLR